MGYATEEYVNKLYNDLKNLIQNSGGAGLTSFQGRTDAAAVLETADVSAAGGLLTDGTTPGATSHIQDFGGGFGISVDVITDSDALGVEITGRNNNSKIEIGKTEGVVTIGDASGNDNGTTVTVDDAADNIDFTSATISVNGTTTGNDTLANAIIAGNWIIVNGSLCPAP
jgi:hypothetical protein